MGKIEQKIENFLLSDNFVELSSKAKKFNVFNVLKLENAEIRHSNFLGWLLSPYQSHLLGDIFLKELLKTALKDHLDNTNLKTSISDIILNDYSDAEVTLEKMTDENRRIDIFIESRRNSFVCIIENKIWSGEGCNQLEDYEKYINLHEKYGSYKHKLFIFLTPDTNYDCTKLYKNYVRLDYAKICSAIDTILKKENVIVNDEVRHFIENYKDMVERNIMKKYDAKTLELCSRIYKEYGDVIDLINKYGAPKISLCNILEEVLEQKDYLKRIYRESDSVILALPSKLSEEQLEKMQIVDWKPDNCFVNIKFSILQWKSDKVTVEILFAPLKSDTNKELKEKFKQALINKNKDFKFGNNKDGWEWTDFGTLISLEEYRSYDSSDDVKKHISEKLDSYKEKYIDSLTEIINEFL